MTPIDSDFRSIAAGASESIEITGCEAVPSFFKSVIPYSLLNLEVLKNDDFKGKLQYSKGY